ncbi:competence type IV pilus major pilin ComGC [Geomicrobium sediminis]|uniref:ComG operon protein 3 n=1 Tax=Geomicrobium sediminis TaxID=1347788 RepID=A0ABS2PE37_9BACL|nr:competence type IV pilus major pilin ComGC [Geomicrobium sediminis]MBM7633695.1 competence protein ComGC [Geomicrobium sediminis]
MMNLIRRFYHDQKGFTLIEMMIVLLIISILLLVAVPNMVKNSDVAHSKSCEATIDLIQSQVGSFSVESGKKAEDITLNDLEGYVERTTCSDGTELEIVNGIVRGKTSNS